MLHEILHFFGGAICHQIEERSLQASGETLSICARDTGIYIGIFSSLIYLHISKRKTVITIPSIKISFFLLLLMVPLMLDGLGSYLHLLETNNIRRLVSGTIFGIALPYFLYPLLSVQIPEETSKPVIQKRHDLIVPFLINCTLGSLVYFGKIPYLLINGFMIIMVILWFSLLASFLYTKLRYKWGISFLTSVGFLSLLSFIHHLLL